MKKIGLLYLIILLYQLHFLKVQEVHLFPLKDVRLLNGPFKDAQNTDLGYMLKLNMDRLLVPFRKDAGIPLKPKIIPTGKAQG